MKRKMNIVLLVKDQDVSKKSKLTRGWLFIISSDMDDHSETITAILCLPLFVPSIRKK